VSERVRQVGAFACVVMKGSASLEKQAGR